MNEEDYSDLPPLEDYEQSDYAQSEEFQFVEIPGDTISKESILPKTSLGNFNFQQPSGNDNLHNYLQSFGGVDLAFNSMLSSDSLSANYTGTWDFPSSDIQKPTSTKKECDLTEDAFCLIISNVVEEDGTEKQDLSEFSLPLEINSVEDYFKLEEIWFYEIDAINMNSKDTKIFSPDYKHIVNPTKKLKPYQLKPSCCYIVCGYSFIKDDPFIRSIRDVKNEKQTFNIPENHISIVDIFTIITHCSFKESDFYLGMTCFDLQLALIEYYKSPGNPVVPFFLRQKDQNHELLELLGTMAGGFTRPEGHISISNKTDKLSALILVAAYQNQFNRLKHLLSLSFINFEYKCDNNRNILHYAAIRSDHAFGKDNQNILDMLFQNDKVYNFVNDFDVKGISPLRMGVTQSNRYFVEILIKKCVERKIEIKLNEKLDCLLCLSCTLNEPLVLLELLKIPNIDYKRGGLSPLMFSVYYDNADLVEVLATHNKNWVVEDNNCSDEKTRFQTPLLHVCGYKKHKKKNNSLKIVQILVKNGANVNFQSKKGNTSLMRAIKSRNEEIAMFLLNFKEQPIDLKIKNTSHKTAYDIACQKKMMKVIEKMGKLTTPIKISKTESLLDLVTRNEIEKLKLCLSSGIFKNINVSNDLLKTGLHLAIELEYTNIAKLLIDYGIKISQKDCFGMTPAHYALVFKNEEILAILLSKNFDVNTQNFSRFSFRNFSLHRNSLKVVPIKSKVFSKKMFNVDPVYNFERYLVFDKKGRCYIRDTYPTENIQTITKTYSDIKKLRLSLPSISLDGYEVIPKLSGVNFSSNPKKMCITYKTKNKKLLPFGEEIELTMKTLKKLTKHIFKNALLKLDLIHQLGTILTILHHNNIFHKNIRFDNILRTKGYTIVIPGFGVEDIIKKFQKTDLSVDDESYNSKKWSKENDIYSFCQTSYRLLYSHYLSRKEILRCSFSIEAYVQKFVGLLIYGMKSSDTRPNMSTLTDEVGNSIFLLISEHSEKCKRNHKPFDFLTNSIIQNLDSEKAEKIKQLNKEKKKDMARSVAKAFVDFKRKISKRKKLFFRFSYIESMINIAFKIDITKMEVVVKKLRKVILEKKVKIKNFHLFEEIISFIKTVCENNTVKCHLSESSFKLIDDLLEESKKTTGLVFPTFDIIRMLLYNKNNIFQLVSKFSEILEKLFFFVNIFSGLKLGGQLMIFRILCNIFEHPDGQNYIFQKDRIKSMKILLKQGINHKKMVVKLASAALLNNISIISHLYQYDLSDLCFEIILSLYKKGGMNVDYVSRILKPLYKLIKHNYEYSEKIRNLAEENEVNLYVFILDLKEMKLHKLLILSLAAMMLDLENFEKVRDNIGFVDIPKEKEDPKIQIEKMY